MWRPCLFITPPGSSLSLFHELPEQNSQQQCTLENHFLVGKSTWAYIISLKLHKEPEDVCITTVLILQTGMLALLRASMVHRLEALMPGAVQVWVPNNTHLSRST